MRKGASKLPNIVKADIVTDVNDNLQINAGANGLDRFILKTLSDMSKKGLLVDTDATQTLADGSKTLNYPTGFRSAINITLTDSSGNELDPLIKLSGGHKEYRRGISHGSFTSNPQWFSEFEGKFYLLGSSSAAYTVLIEYRKNHPADADNIEFSDDLQNLMDAGTTYWKAIQLGRPTGITVWAPVYANEMRKAILDRKQQPSIMLG